MVSQHDPVTVGVVDLVAAVESGTVAVSDTAMPPIGTADAVPGNPETPRVKTPIGKPAPPRRGAACAVFPSEDPNGRQKLSVAPFAVSSSLGTRLCRSIHARTSGDIHPVTSRMRS